MKEFWTSRKFLILLAFGGFIIALDQLTKLYIHTQFQYGEKLPVLDGFFYFTYVRNPGAAFGLFGEAPEAFRTLFFLSLPLVAVGIILYMLKTTPDSDRVQILALSSIFGGAIGNYIDRLRFGYVIDFLDFSFQYNLPLLGQGMFSYPAFNVADISIVTGVCILILLIGIQSYQEHKEKK